MLDAKLTDYGNYYDITFDINGDILTEDALDSSILVSLLVEDRAESYEIAQPERRGGWIGNANAEHKIGSKVWLYRQSRITEEVKNGVRQEIERALAFFVSDGLVKNITVNVSDSNNTLIAEITMFRFDNKVDKKFYTLWDNTGA